LIILPNEAMCERHDPTTARLCSRRSGQLATEPVYTGAATTKPKTKLMQSWHFSRH
jgi:hypothetical protein